jgi:hypothetical protein
LLSCLFYCHWFDVRSFAALLIFVIVEIPFICVAVFCDKFLFSSCYNHSNCCCYSVAIVVIAPDVRSIAAIVILVIVVAEVADVTLVIAAV